MSPDSKVVQRDNLNPFQLVLIGDLAGNAVSVDEVVNALHVIDVFHHEIHEGDAFIISKLSLAVVDDANVDTFIAVGDVELHMNFAAAGAGDAHLFVYEDSTHSSGGVAIIPYNMNRASSNLSSAVFTGGGVNVPGASAIIEQFLPGGTGGNAIGGQTAEREEIILKSNRNYLARLTNKAGNAKDFSTKLTWYEEQM